MSTDNKEIAEKIYELQLFVANKIKHKKDMTDIDKTQKLINDIQLIHHIWTKDENAI